MTTPTTVPCLRCEAPRPRLKRGRPPRFCESCQRERRVEQDRGRKRASLALRRELLDELDAWRASGRLVDLDLDDVDEDTDRPLYATIDEYLVSCDLAPDDDWGLVVDAPLRGSTLPAGPDVGRSTTDPELAGLIYGRRFRDARGELVGSDGLAEQAANHPWWAANPHALYGLPGADGEHDAAEYLSAA